MDKSGFISKFAVCPFGVVALLRPPGFGKTMIMDMLERFFSPPVPGSALPPPAELFKGMDVMKSKHPAVLSQMGRYPVIRVSLRGLCDEHSSMDQVEANLKHLAAEMFKKHSYLLGSTYLSDWDKRKMRKFTEGTAEVCEAEHGIATLSRYLYQHHGNLPYILIDDYDTPLLKSHQSPIHANVLDLVTSFMRAGLKGNENICGSLVTGVTNVGSVWGVVNNVGSVDTILDNTYAQWFGFTEDEVQGLVARSGRGEDERAVLMKQLCEKHGGYVVGDGVKMVNAKAVMQCLKHGQVAERDEDHDARAIATVKHLMQDIYEKANKTDVLQLIHNFESGNNATVSHYVSITAKDVGELCWDLLVLFGYLTAVRRQRTPPDSFYECELQIPNTQELEVFKKAVQDE